MYKLFLYIKFLLKSTNQHGVQSPFVYELVTNCFYNKSLNEKNRLTALFVKDKKLSGKQMKFVNKLVNYFKKDEEDFSSKKDSILKNSTDKFDLIYFDSPDQFHFNKIITILNTNQFVLINNINNSKKQNDTWGSLVKHPLATVTIDIYFFGLIFFRKGQVKEHFIIRP